MAGEWAPTLSMIVAGETQSVLSFLDTTPDRSRTIPATWDRNVWRLVAAEHGSSLKPKTPHHRSRVEHDRPRGFYEDIRTAFGLYKRICAEGSGCFLELGMRRDGRTLGRPSRPPCRSSRQCPTPSRRDKECISLLLAGSAIVNVAKDEDSVGGVEVSINQLPPHPCQGPWDLGGGLK